MPNVDSLNRTLFIGDNLPVLRGIDSESIDLIATDPPFNKGAKAFEGIVTAGVDKQGKKVSYKDIWTWGDVQSEWTESIRQDHPNLYAVIQGANSAAGEDMGAFICWLAVRVLAMHRILKPTGSMYLHIDHTAHAYAKGMMDAIFGRANFRNEIVWRRNESGAKGSQHSASSWGSNIDYLLFYSKGASLTFEPRIIREWDVEEVKRRFPKVDSDGRRYNTKMTAWRSPSMGPRPNLCYAFHGIKPPYPSGWRLGPQRMEQEYQKGNIVIVDGKLERRSYADDYLGVSPGNLWTDAGLLLGAQSSERTGYPTQKPLALYERIISASSNEGDLVLDPFAGCATTCVAAERLGRGWIAVDINEEAKDVVVERLRKEARLPEGKRSWNRMISVKTKPPRRTDDGQEAAPELTLVSTTPRAPKLTARELRARLIVADGLKCMGCGWVPHHEEYLEVDHRVPKSREGRDDIRNRVLLCSPCNGAKGNKLTLAELRLKRIEEKRMVDKSWNMAWYERTGRFG